MIQFKLFNTPVSIHWMFWLLTAFIGGGLRAQTPEQMLNVLIFIIAAFISILIHEFGHVFAGRAVGGINPQIQLHGMGGVAVFPGARFSRKQSILMTAAGPGASILLAIVSYVVLNFILGPSGLDSKISHFFAVMVFINVFWSAFNLCPILPMDGGQILRDFLGPSKIKLTCIISFITLAVIGYLLWMNTKSIYNVIIMAFFASYTLQVWQAASKQGH